nr:unnamed protein product [Spirometra erinaceieuropaei]
MLLRTIKLEEEALVWIEMPGEIFIRLLKLTILPLISANVIIVSSTLNAKENGKISLVALAFIISSNVLAAVSGVVVSLLLKPGASNVEHSPDSNQTYTPEHHLRTSSIFADLLYNLFPDNVIGVTLYQSRTTYQIISKLAAGNSSKLLKRTITNVSSMNMLGLLFCSFIFGAAAGKAGERGKVFLDFFRSVADVVLKIMNLFLLLSRFVVPLSATLKGDGSAVFIAASTLFIAQLTQTTVTAGTITIVCLLSSSAVLAIPNIPSSSIVILVTILSSLGIPANHVGLLFALEWLLDRLRSTNLAVLHLYCVALTQYVCKGKPIPPEGQADDLQSSSHAVSKTGEDKVASEMSELLNGDVSLSA